MFESYSLVDSGNLLKLERFGSKTIIRPSTVAIWKTKKPRSDWQMADATYEPKQGWQFKNGKFESWELDIKLTNGNPVRILMRLQQNGQVGIFPEHSMYLEQLADNIKGREVLNLFAYTGMASVYLASLGAKVTHVDLAKKSLDWAAQNVDLNPQIKKHAGEVRYIKEDALKFLKREVKRDRKYSVVIVDPPSFSRLSADDFWQIENIVVDLLHDCKKVLENSQAKLLFTHHAQFPKQAFLNVVMDVFDDRKVQIVDRSLLIPEADTDRKMPSGYMFLVSY